MKKMNVGFRNKKSKSMLIAAVALSAVISIGHCQFASAAVSANTSVSTNTSATQNTAEDFSIPEGAKTVIGKTVKDNKIKVTLTDCYVDAGMLVFTTHLDSRERDDYAQELNPQIYVNNKLINRDTNNFSYDYIHNDDNTCDIVTHIYLDDIDTSQNLNITVDYKTIGVTSNSDVDSDIKGNWKVDFTINASQIGKLILNKDINQIIKIGGHALTVQNIKIFPYRIELTAGNDIDEDSDDSVWWIIKDNKGNQANIADGHGSQNKMTYNYYIDNTEINNIIITPRTSFNNAKTSTDNYDKSITVNVR